jgi:beta-glucosidase-like glycosyl hydrolase
LTVKGIQENGVIATAKHFLGNEQEEYRMDIIPHGLMKAISSNIDDRTLHELYAWPFAEAVRAGVGAVMASYNDVNGSDDSQNSMLLNGILKDEIGFQGLVMSDWYGQIGGVSSALAGLDMAMPGGKSLRAINYFLSQAAPQVVRHSLLLGQSAESEAVTYTIDTIPGVAPFCFVSCIF